MIGNSAQQETRSTILAVSLAMVAPMAGREDRFERLRDLPRMRSYRVFGALLVLLFLPAAGCMTMGLAPMTAMSSGEQRGAGAPAGSNADLCPVHVPGTTVEVADTQDYVALLFVTRGGDVDDLRNRVRYLAEMHGQTAANSTGGGHQEMQHGMMGCMMMDHEGGHGSTNAAQPPDLAARATVDDIPGGARLTLVPIAPTPLEALRSHVHQDAQIMQHGECSPMSMDGQPGAVPGQTAPEGHRH